MSVPLPVASAQRAQSMTGMPASVTLAQWIVESDHGSAMPAGSNNPFGIKAKAGEPFVSSMTHEFIGGRWIRTMAHFRAFKTVDDAFVAHGLLITTGEPYAGIHKYLGDPEKLAMSLTGIYATDPEYGHTLVKTMNEYNLWQYDKLPASTGVYNAA